MAGLVMRLNRYGFVFSNVPGKKRILADALSRDYLVHDQTNAAETRTMQVTAQSF